MFQQLVITAGISLFTTTIALAAIRPVLLSSGILDVPNHRSSHITPTVRAGGIGITIGLLCALIYGCLASRADGKVLLLFTAVIVCIAVLGLVEDIHGLSVRNRLIGQALLGGVLAGGLFHQLTPLQRAGAALLGMAGMVFYVNAANFMDGINSISSLHGLVAGLYFSLVGVQLNVNGLGVAGLSVALCFIMFLPWNAPRARMFMGDTGSYALGGAVAGLGMWAISLGTPSLTAVAPMGIYALDVVRTLAVRYRQGKSLVMAHRDHIYQQLQRALGSHSAASTVATLTTIGCCVAGFTTLVRPPLSMIAIGVMILLGAGYLISPTLVVKVTGQEITE